MIKIGTAGGFEIHYDEKRKQFALLDAQGDEVASGATQEEVEKKAEKLSKQTFNFPIPAFKKGANVLCLGRITSINPDDRSAYFAFDDKKSYGSHQKLNLRFGQVFELTEANSRIFTEVTDSRAQINEIEEKIRNLLSQLEKPMGLPYFGIEEGY